MKKTKGAFGVALQSLRIFWGAKNCSAERKSEHPSKMQSLAQKKSEHQKNAEGLQSKSPNNLRKCRALRKKNLNTKKLPSLRIRRAFEDFLIKKQITS